MDGCPGGTKPLSLACVSSGLGNKPAVGVSEKGPLGCRAGGSTSSRGNALNASSHSPADNLLGGTATTADGGGPALPPGPDDETTWIELSSMETGPEPEEELTLIVDMMTGESEQVRAAVPNAQDTGEPRSAKRRAICPTS